MSSKRPVACFSGLTPHLKEAGRIRPPGSPGESRVQAECLNGSKTL